MLLAAHYYGRLFPMMMTAAGTLKAARAVVLGAGVAGLQAIATAKRLGAVVEASDVRPAARASRSNRWARNSSTCRSKPTREREIAQGVGGYARPMPPSCGAAGGAGVQALQAGRHHHHHRALIPGRPALVSAETVAGMKPGSVLVDLQRSKRGGAR